jgi:hypothetical protein
MSIEFLLGVGDGLGTVIVGIVVALIRSWNSGYLRHYFDGCEQETEECEDEQDRFENLVERVDSMEERVESIEERVEDTETES